MCALKCEFVFLPISFIISCSFESLSIEFFATKKGCVPLNAAADVDSISVGIMIVGWDGED